MNLPKLIVPRSKSETLTKKLSPQFDFRTGEFLFAGGKIQLGDGFQAWCIKVSATERSTRACYSDKIGVELQGLPQIADPQAAKSQIIRTITEAIMIHPRTQSVKNFSFTTEGDRVYAGFDINGKRLEAAL